MLKMDVEGHEPAILEGAGRLLGEGRIRDIVFEDYEPQPSRCAAILKGAGFAIFAIVPRWFGLRLVALDEWPRLLDRYPPNFVATRDPRRLQARLGAFGWRCLWGASTGILRGLLHPVAPPAKKPPITRNCRNNPSQNDRDESAFSRCRGRGGLTRAARFNIQGGPATERSGL